MLLCGREGCEAGVDGYLGSGATLTLMFCLGGQRQPCKFSSASAETPHRLKQQLGTVLREPARPGGHDTLLQASLLLLGSPTLIA